MVRGFPEQERPSARCPPTPRSWNRRKGVLAVAVGKRDWWGEVGGGDKGGGGRGEHDQEENLTLNTENKAWLHSW